MGRAWTRGGAVCFLSRRRAILHGHADLTPPAPLSLAALSLVPRERTASGEGGAGRAMPSEPPSPEGGMPARGTRAGIPTEGEGGWGVRSARAPYEAAAPSSWTYLA